MARYDEWDDWRRRTPRSRGYDRQGEYPGGSAVNAYRPGYGYPSPAPPRPNRYDRSFERPNGGWREDRFSGRLDAPGRAREPWTDISDDDEIRMAVRRNLFADRWLRADAIQVAVTDGVVTLEGKVDDYLEARYAWDDAWDTTGVRGVVSRLEVANGGEDG